MRDVVDHGTGVRAKAIGRPSAGKTGTTNDSKDAWYIGFIPQLLTGYMWAMTILNQWEARRPAQEQPHPSGLTL